MPDSTATPRRFLVGVFTEEDAILAVTRAATAAKFPVHDVYTPYAVHGLDEAQGLPRSKVTWIAFFGGIAGLLTATALQVYTQGITTPLLSGWPLNIGGKPFLPLPAFVPVWFEMTVLFAGLSAAVGMFVVNRLYPGKTPRILVDGVTNDRFAIAFDPTGERADESAIRALLHDHAAAEIVWLEEAPAEPAVSRRTMGWVAAGGLVPVLVALSVWAAANSPHEEPAPAAAPVEPPKPVVLLSEADLAGIATDAKLVAQGSAKFTVSCVVCHGDKAEGKVGPNLTDKYWLHGKGTLADIYATIAKGVPEKGMPSWAATMSADDLRALTAFVGSIRGTNVAGKEPQGAAVEGVPPPASQTSADAPTAPAAAPTPPAK